MNVTETMLQIEGDVVLVKGGAYTHVFDLVRRGDGPQPHLACVVVNGAAGAWELTYEKSPDLGELAGRVVDVADVLLEAV